VITTARIDAQWRPLEAGAVLRVSLQGGPLSVAWTHPERGEWAAGCGVAAEGDGEIAWREPPPPGCPGPWFGGWSFGGVERWFLPRVLAWWSGGRTYVAAFGPDAEASLAQVTEAEPAIETPRAVALPGDRGWWAHLVQKALEQIAEGQLSKVVVARRIAVEGDRPFDERRVLKALEARFPSCRSFLQRTAAGAFVGATPELLARVKGRVLETEALAGTGDGEALLSSEKDLREHRFVVDAIVQTLRPLCSDIEVGEVGLRRLANVTHLRTPLRATLKDGVPAVEAARALHPTPAVGGSPRAAALGFLAKHEGFDRGPYAGAVGVRGADTLELWVAIRSALLEGARATVYAGAGIVAGSTPEAEWAETERKAKALLGALGADHV
jgi:salicylate biosynthesis isochorismate synthase/menaquinone-specific isochorismate synthase